ncbi:MAG: bi-domain-containing oxidoreductase [Victivallales bacterium]|nr:bi-domain-containing oxidoreductase [Victivallales bacterium]
MKQIIQNMKSGETILTEVPAPQIRPGQLLIRTRKSLVSLGTERMLVEFGRSNLLQKARQQPDKVKMVLDKIKTDGLMPTVDAVFKKLDQPLPLGYSNVGEVIAVGAGIKDFKTGDRVVSNGPHAEFVSVPQNLAAHIPENVSDDEAAFTILGAVGLQGIRLAAPQFGESVAVIGLGLIGLITADLLQANGCKVIGIDLDKDKLRLAENRGIETVNVSGGLDPVSAVLAKTGGNGADAVIITASAKGNEIISQAAGMSRKRGRIILVGVTGLNISRAEFYKKELSFQVSCSYGPGRYDNDYEQKGHDYPPAFVRWTEKRNFEAILDALAAGRIDVKPLVSEIVPLADFGMIYNNIGSSGKIASLLAYPADTDYTSAVSIAENAFAASPGVMAIAGTGNFTSMTMLPALKQCAAKIKYLVSAGGLSGTAEAGKYGIPVSSTDFQDVLSDPEVDLVLIATRHNLHASMIDAALEAGKNVFVEKPLALNETELQNIIKAYEQSGKTVTVGYNRRFSPHILKIKELIGEKPEPLNIIATINAGNIPADVWIHDMQEGGGRIIGEACHFIDLVSFIAASPVQSAVMSALGKNPAANSDNAIITLKCENGSQGVINYFANGSKTYAKERIEVFAAGKVLILDNFRVLSGYGFKNFKRLKTRLDKGHNEQFRRLARQAQNGGSPLIPFADVVNSARASFAAIESLKLRKWIEL